MLKIEDNIDLKELEKFDFKECRDCFYYQLEKYQKDICINKKTKTISLVNFNKDIKQIKRDRRTNTLKEIDIVKQLIKAEFVKL